MQAIHSGLKYIQSHHQSANQNYLILTDLLSSIHTLQNLTSKPQNALYHSILDTHELLLHNKQRVVFTWIPSHVGILSIKIADKLAKQATALDSTQLPPTYTFSQTYKAINNSALLQWQQTYINSKKAQHYKILKATVSFALKSSFNNVPNKVHIITAIKLGTLCVNQCLFKFNKHPTALLCNRPRHNIALHFVVPPLQHLLHLPNKKHQRHLI